MPSHENKRLTRRVLEEMFEQGDLDAADELIHPEFVNHEAPPENPQGPEGLKQTDELAARVVGRHARRYRRRDLRGRQGRGPGDHAGQHDGEFLGKPPTGKEFAMQQIHICRFEDGRVIEHWAVRDDLGQALQLGLIGG